MSFCSIQFIGSREGVREKDIATWALKSIYNVEYDINISTACSEILDKSTFAHPQR